MNARTLLVATALLGSASLVSAQAKPSTTTTSSTATKSVTKAAPAKQTKPAAKTVTTKTTTTTVGTGAIAESKPGLTAQATVQPDDARKTALGTVTNGRITHEKLTEQSGKLIYRFTVKEGKKRSVVVVDAKTGAIVPAKATVSKKMKKVKK